ncbi:hypothetical protein Mkiyose1665_27710 [Mycobacterium kiyosense]|uniref:TerD domain-containing protein n=1 Tax=Mycobacterium kiyosense TaxID=2871094 RepID=A0A9P3Q6W2_9MYCO|nr:hypothetical protein IWGMT90018_17270 [Mycobacterium kiyosense]BDE13036.1 hypothetical protein MKCMC460_18960 [Mycobacterium sp. 20KCMC460]GLB81994.1 hypothetical protein SRL2020028_12500 [Mycobacterium kiyosense]GLB89505.1 hypothetical protein SRL2020130_23220 [Mycobacterium kiyosense]GLB95136.1 hypothetical protein SRL2020226_19120 [Mycobacterium kiyosense]
MGVSLNKGGNVSLTKQAPHLTAVAVGLGWDSTYDLDASALACGANRKMPEPKRQWCSASSTGATASGSFAPSARVTPRDCAA